MSDMDNLPRLMTHLDFYRPQVLANLLLHDMVLHGGAGRLLFLFDAQSGSRFSEVVALEFAQESQNFIVREQRGSVI